VRTDKNISVITGNEKTAFVVGLAGALIAKGAALFPLAYSVDDYSKVLSPERNALGIDFLIGQGRFGLALLSQLVFEFGIAPPFTNILYAVYYMATLIVVSLLLARLWRLSDDVVLISLLVLAVTLHPYQAELFIFRVSPFYVSTATLMAFTGLYYCDAKPGAIFLSSLCLTAALSIYQVAFNLIFVTFLFALIFELLRQLKEHSVVDWRQAALEVALWPRLAMLSSGLVLYLVSNKAVQFFFNVPPITRAQFLPLHDLQRRADDTVTVLKNLLMRPEPVLPMAVKILLGIIGCIALFQVTRTVLSDPRGKKKIFYLTAIISMLLIASLGIPGVSLVAGWLDAVPRVLSAVSIYCGGLLAISYMYSGAQMRKAVIWLSIVLVIVFAGINNHIFYDQLRLNTRDRMKAARMVGRLESFGEFSQIKRLAITNSEAGYPSPIQSSQGGINNSAFIPSWSKVPLVKEISGYDFGMATGEEQQLAEKLCAAHPKWPHPESVFLRNDLAIICQ
jgi:hypothetical protein